MIGCTSSEPVKIVGHQILIAGHGYEGRHEYWLIRNSWGHHRSSLASVARDLSEADTTGGGLAEKCPPPRHFDPHYRSPTPSRVSSAA